MKKVQQTTSVVLILGLVMIFHAEGAAFSGAAKNADCDALAAGNLSGQ